MNTPNQTQTARPGSLHPDCSALDFQSAPYDVLCGCVAAFVPSAGKWAYESFGEDRPNPRMTRYLIEQAVGERIVTVNCPRCHGTGLAPNDKISDRR
jgi:hypothetical protein